MNKYLRIQLLICFQLVFSHAASLDSSAMKIDSNRIDHKNNSIHQEKYITEKRPKESIVSVVKDNIGE
jgi:hypothetical protein